MKQLLLFTLLSSSLAAIPLSSEEINRIGMKIFANECGSKKENLIFWHPQEPFPSLGICHSIWYPEGYKGPYTQTFPELARFLQSKGITLAHWMTRSHCPWKTREEFLADKEKKEIIIQMLSNTMEQQTLFAISRLEHALPSILKKTNIKRKAHVRNMFTFLSQSVPGTFALIDYINFKGEGTNEKETYQETGWGLRQVLEHMPATTTAQKAVTEFVASAQHILEQRAKLAPPGSPDSQRLVGWTNRVKRYLE